MSDLDLPIRDRTYRVPQDPHVVLVRGRDLGGALDHLRAREDCSALAVIAGLPEVPPGLDVLKGRRLLVCDRERSRMREFAQAGMAAGAEVEWINSDKPSFERLAAWALPVGAIVLAAGNSTRMGGQDKLLLPAGGLPLVRHVVEAAHEGGCHFVTVVHSSPEVAAAVQGYAQPVHNPEAASGMASSLRRGLEAQPAEVVGALLMLGDQPLVGSRTVEMLLRCFRREGARKAVACAYAGGRRPPEAPDGRPNWRPPVLLDRSLWPDLAALTGDAGARQLLGRHPELLDTVMVSGRPDDVDTPQDYAKIVHLFPRPDQG